MDKRHTRVYDLCSIGLFAAVIAVCAQIQIPLPGGVPLTLQTLAVTLAGIALGPAKGCAAAAAYVAAGAAGLPVFSGFAGGMGILFGPTGGFILSFPLMALTAGIGGITGRRIYTAAGIFFGMTVNYLCGTVFFSYITAVNLGISFARCVLPFIPGDVIKMAAAILIGEKVKKSR